MLIEDDKITFRTVTIGDSCVGKTCIINRFIRDSFNPEQRNTVGSLFDSFTAEREGHSIIVHLWDTAGQEQYRSLGTVYFRSAAAAFVVFDITNRQSFKNCGEWLTSFRGSSGDSPVVFLVGNKCDMSNENRQVTEDEARSFAIENGMKYFETSALTGENVQLLFDSLVDELYKTNIQDSSRIVNVSKLAGMTPENQTSHEKNGCC
ncbi:Ras family protein [Tritrichomonas foetus]|uniref:Ras family protein n=1 Tax=Tritrichomonas foetus TaxID=1144522 RepID=A0A1J4KE66_9EUKA|nr:Ras family protein [Tritrichomonas foetus]|eukprot:OHT09483.1 Ras family protein [Tritrichomonas foetus]